ncbi:conserved exported protein of unknown function [Rhodovastum atsumiense]|uniref:Uncharacterized protein n=1 Tax=Rhodovastum atsumiense TaxID=504468 RepID=A0A5M6IRK0_9PROT|nr:hypothetical protein [Rhodovastum atsumiense]KAA5610811.1 hypothetical protein F1189_17170 [Rhodovastum atsumiense]CAH2602143.1 conserved exported protein of unknown function [Rhodovastum atsumiense]
MRARLLPGFAVLVLAAGSALPGQAAEQCLQAAEKTAFEVRALQSQLMVAALTCGQQDDYNAFVQRSQPVLMGAYQQIAAHFERLYGGAGEEQRDAYLSELANVQSQDMARRGNLFCRSMTGFFQQALMLRSPEEMARFVNMQHVANPYALPGCGSTGYATRNSGYGRDREVAVASGSTAAYAWAAPATDAAPAGRDADTYRLEARLSEVTRANEQLQRRIDALESALYGRQSR